MYLLQNHFSVVTLGKKFLLTLTTSPAFGSPDSQVLPAVEHKTPTKSENPHCNIRSLSRHFIDLKGCPKLEDANAICLQETWLKQDQEEGFNIKGMEKHLNSVGHGKGIASYFISCYSFIKTEKYQLTKITKVSQDIINVYRSAGASSS